MVLSILCTENMYINLTQVTECLLHCLYIFMFYNKRSMFIFKPTTNKFVTKDSHINIKKFMLFWVFMTFCILVTVDTPTYDVPGNEEPKETRRKWLFDLCVKYVHEYLISFEVEPVVEQLQKMDEAKRMKCSCRFEGCNKNFIHHSMRVK